MTKVRFLSIDETGKQGPTQDIDVSVCPHLILVQEHYREDGTCRCNDPTAVEMAGWGYLWDGQMWVSGGPE